MLGYRTLTIALPDPVWTLAKRLQDIVNVKLKGKGKPPMNLSGIVTIVLLNILVEQAADIQDEYDQMGLHQLAVQLADALGPDGLAAAGLPEVPVASGAGRRVRPTRFFS